jgi:KRAB domain-containing zinc finger protein
MKHIIRMNKDLDDNKDAVHKVTQHTDRKDFKCDMCDYKGAMAKYLRRHNDAAHESVPHPCQECDYQATNKCYLKEHILTKHRGQVYSCDQCN